ncbi:hypothetical protein PoB_002416100 [Plakobranchus ocellatus]|uniref:Uncharacterized protein n=1 Tax=Plakobranchus ocellatus TaxID=259542 RepID=A0AAV3ZEJ2_9GAST|nr:hypothetical protein PoB_002416100 [Plakobranchus ocellatus]
MSVQEVQLPTRDRQFGKTSECAHKRSNSHHGVGNFCKTSECAHKMSNSQHGIGESAKLPNVHTRGPTLNTGKAVWQDFRICTQEVQLSTWDRKFSKTSECAHKMSNSQHGIGNLARLPNMHTRGATLNKVSRQDIRMYTQEVELSTRDRNLARLPNMLTRGPTLNTGKAVWQDFRICTQEVQLSTWDRKFRKTSECAHKMSNSQHGIGNLGRLPNMYTRCATLNKV